MSNKAKVATEEVETQNEEIVATEEVETIVDIEQNRDGYTVKVNLKRNGKRYFPGEKIMIEDESAMILLADGVIE